MLLLCFSCIHVDAIAYDRAFFGQGSTQMGIFMDNVACGGTESRLIDCPFDRHTADCIHAEDAGVRCQEGVLYYVIQRFSYFLQQLKQNCYSLQFVTINSAIVTQYFKLFTFLLQGVGNLLYHTM